MNKIYTILFFSQQVMSQHQNQAGKTLKTIKNNQI